MDQTLRSHSALAPDRSPAVEQSRNGPSRFDLVHSIDAPALLQRLDEAAAAAGRRLDLLVQVDLAGEATKHGARKTS